MPEPTQVNEKPDLLELAGLALAAAKAAGALLLDGLAGVRTVETKTTATDMVSEMDRASEDLIARAILGARPGDAFLGEEGTTGGSGSTGVRWVVDPLDGTTNYLYGFPSWAVSIAAEIDGEVAVGVVHDPFHDETFRAVRGSGSWCNDQRLQVTGAGELASSLVATGFGYDPAVRTSQAEVVARLISSVRDIRRAGAASVDLCWLALGRVDIYYERGLQPWDWAAASLVASEAGALLEWLADGTLVAAAPQLLDPFVRLLRDAGGGILD